MIAASTFRSADEPAPGERNAGLSPAPAPAPIRRVDGPRHKHAAYTRERIRRVRERIEGAAHRASIQPTDLAHHGPTGRGRQADAASLGFEAVAPGFTFGPAWSTHWFRLRYELPAGWAGREVRLHWFSGCEATLWRPVAGGLEVVQGLNPRQPEAVIPDADGTVTLYVEAACNDLLGNGEAPGREPPGLNLSGVAPGPRPPFRVDACRLFAVDAELEAIGHDLRVLSELEADRDPPQRSKNVGDQRASTVRPALDTTWAGRLLFGVNEFCNDFDLDDLRTWGAARERLTTLLGATNGSVVHELTAIGHNHIDTAWLWPLEETHRKTLRSWTAQLNLMDRYPGYTFACSQAYQYEHLRREHPGVFGRIQRRVESGEWQPAGGTWIEPDCNLPSGESLVRQFLEGQRWFEGAFGRRCHEFWNPDVFGYNGQLPQILAHCGVNRFLTQKLSWNKFTTPPHHTFFWKGIDGTGVLTHFPPADTYNAKGTVEELRYHAANYKDADRSGDALYLFGHGDGGGGATPAMLETLVRCEDLLGVPRVSFRSVDAFFERLEADSESLASVAGEMYFELHRGTFTSQAELKRLNREGEVALFEAEAVLAMRRIAGLEPSADAADRKTLREAWRTLLLNQFHDILTGSCTHEVAERAKGDLRGVLATALRVRDAALRGGPTRRREDAASADADATGWLNLSGTARREVTESGGTLGMVRAEPWSRTRFVTTTDRVTVEETPDGGFVLGNAALRAVVGADGEVHSLVDADTGREALAAPAGLRRFVDEPNLWDAWDIDPHAAESEHPLPPASSVRVTREDDLRVELEVVRDLGGGDRAVQTFRLDAESPCMEIVHAVDWSQRHRLLRFEVPTGIVADAATFEIPFGVIRRPTHANTQADVAQFEVPGQRFVDLSDLGFGVSLLADCKYGYSARGGTLGVSLLRGPTYPDPKCDVGHHRFTLRLHPHAGGWHESDCLDGAETLTRPLVPASAAVLDEIAGSFEMSGDAVLSALKLAEDRDAVIARFYEPSGRGGAVTLRLDANVARVWESNGLEDLGDPLEVDDDGGVTVTLRSHQVRTLSFELEPTS